MAVLSIAGLPARYSTTRNGPTGSALSNHPVKQQVLASFEVVDGLSDLRAMFGHRVGVRLGVVKLDRSARRFRNERPDTHVTGLIGKLSQLLVNDPEFLAQMPQARTHLL